MTISLITIKLYASDSQSLKDKRSITKSIKDKLSNNFNISIIESDAQDVLKTIMLSIVYLCDSDSASDSISQSIENFIEENLTNAIVVDFYKENI